MFTHNTHERAKDFAGSERVLERIQKEKFGQTV